MAAANAGRAVKIVLAQMLEYADDEAAAQAARGISDLVEIQARIWLTTE